MYQAVQSNVLKDANGRDRIGPSETLHLLGDVLGIASRCLKMAVPLEYLQVRFCYAEEASRSQSLSWVAVQELNSCYYVGETRLFIYIYMYTPLLVT